MVRREQRQHGRDSGMAMAEAKCGAEEGSRGWKQGEVGLCHRQRGDVGTRGCDLVAARHPAMPGRTRRDLGPWGRGGHCMCTKVITIPNL